jgi:O-acetyl-ADP-ribose deacetylase (regulator of RNase III)
MSLRVSFGRLADFPGDVVLRAVRADLDPVNVASREVAEEAGETIRTRLEQAGELPVGGAVLTPGGALPAGFVIHVVTSSRDEPETPATVERGLRNALRRAADWEMDSLAVPPLGTGVGVLTLEDAARLQVRILAEHLEEGVPPREITVVVGNAYEEDVFSRLVAPLCDPAGEGNSG